jgi:anti-anti-sigma factor
MSDVRVFEPSSRILSTNSTSDILTWVNDNIQAGCTEMLIDLRNVIFMDSRGLGVLVVALTRIQEVGGRLALCSLNGQARMLIELADVGQMFDVYEDRSEFQRHRLVA